MRSKDKLGYALYVLGCIVFLCILVYVVFNERQKHIEKYDQGVQYYESGDYVKAMEIFNDLKLEGWRGRAKISPEDYYNMALIRLAGSKSEEITICPECGAVITKIAEGGQND